ncbi:MAG: hypothetical protein K9M08_02105 [Pirellula sp.]|nr:hypothetical protein [Pirellula sp.]
MKRPILSDWTALFCVFALASCLSLAPASGDELTKFKDCAIANASCWRQYDCLIRMDYFQPDDDSDVALTRFIRLAVDFEANQFFCVNISEQRRGDTKLSIATVGQFNGKVGYFRSFPGEKNKVEPKLLDVLKNMDIPDLRCVGLLDFPTRFGSAIEGDMETFDSICSRRNNPASSSGDVLPVVREISSDSEIRFTQKLDRLNVLIGSSFDPVTLMPRTKLITSKREPVSLPETDEYYEWKDLEGTFVPISVINESGPMVSVVNADNPDKKKQRRVLKVVMARVHWFSLNQKIDSDLMNGKLMDDLAKIRSLADPVHTDASDLVSK